MLTLKQIRDDLKDIRYYYSRKEAFENGFRMIGSNDIVGKAKRYNTAVQSAPTRLYDIYVGLYARNLTQEALSVELCYTPEYIQILNKRLLLFLQNWDITTILPTRNGSSPISTLSREILFSHCATISEYLLLRQRL